MHPLDAQKKLIEALEAGAASFSTLVEKTGLPRHEIQLGLDRLEQIGVSNSTVAGTVVMYHLCSQVNGERAVEMVNASPSEEVTSVSDQVRDLLIKAGDAGISPAEIEVQGSRNAKYTALQYWKRKGLARLEDKRWYWVKPVVLVTDDDKTAPIDIPVKLKDGAEVVGRIRSPAQEKLKVTADADNSHSDPVPQVRVVRIQRVTARLEMGGMFTIIGYGQELLVNPANARELGYFLLKTAEAMQAR
ncbi:hypothetical protein [Aquitalea aquatica]|uniref:Uncharacterized protein n=1 Tax=Aquitalea aquatica TaxID=3044273 RepID=A0A838YAE3_9NEIS|nr:hypothetical protein [Aquitalea magnusonii]MBA4707744.1 hypothetical protein [Aquitalea magnusonii]